MDNKWSWGQTVGARCWVTCLDISVVLLVLDLFCGYKVAWVGYINVFLRNLCNQKYLKPSCSCTSVILFLQVMLYFFVVFGALQCVYEMKSNKLFTHTNSKARTEITLWMGLGIASWPSTELQILKRRPVTLQGKDEKESALCKCPLMQFKQQLGKTQSFQNLQELTH